MALDLLARREHSREELMRKLCGKGFERGQASAVVQALAQQGWVSDSRFAQQYVRERVARGFGPLRISSELNMGADLSVTPNILLMDNEIGAALVG